MNLSKEIVKDVIIKSKNRGGMNMTNNNIKTMGTFAKAIKESVERLFGSGYQVRVQNVIKNNNRKLTGICILKKGTNIAPTIYLNEFFEEYRKGSTVDQICKEVIQNYEDSKTDVDNEFDVEAILKFDRIKDRICYKLINAEKNQELLSNAPHILFHDLAIIFYVLVTNDCKGTGTITIKNNLKNIWCVNTDTISSLARANTQRLFKGKVSSMTSVISGLMRDKLGDDYSDECIDMLSSDNSVMAMYVATNDVGINGAGVLLYDILLKDISDRVKADFIILPSSIHELILIPALYDIDINNLRSMVREVNWTQVAPDEILSNNIYIYNRDTGLVEML